MQERALSYDTLRPTAARGRPCAQLPTLPGAALYRRRMAGYLDLEAVAEMLGVDRSVAYGLVRTGELLGVKVNAGWRVERAEVQRYKASH